MTNHRSESHSFSVSSTISRWWARTSPFRLSSPVRWECPTRLFRVSSARFRRLGDRDPRADDVRQPVPDRAGSTVLDARARTGGHRRRDGEPAEGIVAWRAALVQLKARSSSPRSPRSRSAISDSSGGCEDISPLVIAPVIVLIGLSLFNSPDIATANQNWWLVGLTLVAIVLFSQYLGEKSNIFQLFPVLLGIVVVMGNRCRLIGPRDLRTRRPRLHRSGKRRGGRTGPSHLSAPVGYAERYARVRHRYARRCRRFDRRIYR